MTEPPICLIAYRDQRPDTALAGAARRLEAAGIRVGGLLQDGQAGDASRCATLFLEDIATGRRVQIFEKRGAGARGCRLDSTGLAVAAGWVREAIARRPDVLFVNRFGRQEAEGRGLLDEIGAAAAANIPLVIALNEALLPAWRAYAGEGTVQVAADGIEAWYLDYLAPATA